jgi:hypothetical protein
VVFRLNCYVEWGLFVEVLVVECKAVGLEVFYEGYGSAACRHVDDVLLAVVDVCKIRAFCFV